MFLKIIDQRLKMQYFYLNVFYSGEILFYKRILKFKAQDRKAVFFIKLDRVLETIKLINIAVDK